MEILPAIILDILEQGFIYAIMAMGIYISYKVLHFPDISVDGTFPLGAAITAVCVLNGVNPWLSLLLAFIAGAIAGSITGILHVIFKINKLFSGIIVMTMMYSINLLIMQSSNVPLFNTSTIFNTAPAKYLPSITPSLSLIVFITVFSIAIIMKFAIDYFLQSERGLLFRASGDNEQIVKAMGKDPGNLKILGLSLSNALVALSGAVLAQQQRYFEISMGTGTMTMGLASVIMGTVLLGKLKLLKETTMVIVGAILYKALVALAINLGAPSYMLNFIRAALFLAILLGNHAFQKETKNA